MRASPGRDLDVSQLKSGWRKCVISTQWALLLLTSKDFSLSQMSMLWHLAVCLWRTDFVLWTLCWLSDSLRKCDCLPVPVDIKEQSFYWISYGKPPSTTTNPVTLLHRMCWNTPVCRPISYRSLCIIGSSWWNCSVGTAFIPLFLSHTRLFPASAQASSSVQLWRLLISPISLGKDQSLGQALGESLNTVRHLSKGLRINVFQILWASNKTSNLEG